MHVRVSCALATLINICDTHLNAGLSNPPKFRTATKLLSIIYETHHIIGTTIGPRSLDLVLKGSYGRAFDQRMQKVYYVYQFPEFFETHGTHAYTPTLLN